MENERSDMEERMGRLYLARIPSRNNFSGMVQIKRL
jgi:hypothetical protein